MYAIVLCQTFKLKHVLGADKAKSIQCTPDS